MEAICTIKQGKLKGRKEENLDGGLFFSFAGIPYAKPPIGNLRFKNPQPAEDWTGIRDATEEGSPCFALQPKFTEKGLETEVQGSEDCLFLNVYTRKVPDDDEQCLKPVMLYIHGGAFVLGSGSRLSAGPSLLMTQDIVLVTINYRLGALGFLSLEDSSLGVSGNAGLKDQVQALKWVQENIKSFGGDPKNVTIFGQSAGGASVHYLMLSPLCKNLFHKAIIQSGSVLNPWACGQNNTKQFAQKLGCKEKDERKILEFLQKVPVEELIEVQIKMGDWLHTIEKRYFSPSIEKECDGAFLTEDPKKLLSKGNYNKVPILIGYTSAEGLMMEASLQLQFTVSSDEFVPFAFQQPRNSLKYNEINQKISEFYFGTPKSDPNNKKALFSIYSDTIFIHGIHEAVLLHTQSSDQPVYLYKMTLETELITMKKILKLDRYEGVCHADDTAYLFTPTVPNLKPGSPEEIGVRRFVKMWTNFAATGKPIPVQDSLLDAEWKPVKENELHFMEIGAKLTPGINPDAERMRFWDQLTQENNKMQK